MSDIFERVQKVVVESLGVEKEAVVRDAKIMEDLGADSLDLVELVMAFEEEFNIEIPDEESAKLDSVGAATDWISAKLEKLAA